MAASVLMLGATGFVGRAVARAVLERGNRLRVLVRDAGRASELAAAGAEVVAGNALDPDDLRSAAVGMDRAVSLMAVRRNRPQRLAAVNVDGPRLLAAACRVAELERLVFVSAIGAAPNPKLRYLSSRWMGEEEIRRSLVPATILRFSFVLGDDGGIIDDFAKAVVGPVAIVPGSGRMRSQPIIREDAARCVALALEQADLTGSTVELGGPEILTYDQLFALWTSAQGVNRPVVHVPLALIHPGALVMEAVLPSPMIVPDELRTIRMDNVAPSVDVVRQTFDFQPQAPSAWAPEHWSRA